MLHSIHIQNYAVIDDLRVEFSPGLNLLSGETGSGKSILVDALGLALGGRASPDIIRTGEARATVAAVFRAEGKSAWSAWLEEYGLGGSDEVEIILRREIQAGGKSRMLVNDQPVTLTAMKPLARQLVEMHGQNEHVSLFAREAQLDLLDQFGELEELLRQVRELYSRSSELENELEGLSHDEQERLRTIDLLKFQVEELERAKLNPGEDTRLEDEKRILANLEKIRTSAAGAFALLYEDEGSACERLARAARQLEELQRYDPAIGAHLTTLAGVRATLEDLASFLRDYLGKLEANPQRLEELEDRLVLIDRLKRKYGGTVDEVLASAERTREQLAGLEHADERREEVRAELDEAKRAYRKAAEDLSQCRREVAKKFAKLVREELAELGMEKTRLEIQFETLSEGGGPRGIDEIEFRISPNPGEELRPLETIASGGEISRLMLAFKTVVGLTRRRKSSEGKSRGNARGSAPTFVFDEVDSGIGGRVAESVGQRLKRLARDAQVLCVTHLAQIACFADHHFHVEKLTRAGRTLTTVRYLRTDNERAEELARMLSGSRVTDAALRHAATLLKQAVG
jgi:DNA repair protein RecN (Recombination protein N)